MYYFIVNPNARSGTGKSIWKQLRHELLLRKIPYKAYLTEYSGHAVTLSNKLSTLGTKESPIYLIAVGGDGTLQEVLNGIRDFDHIYFGYIPTGSGNDFCRSMGIPSDPIKALHAILKKERILSMDIPVVHYRDRQYRFGISAGMGFDAAVCQEVSVSPVKRVLNRFGLGKLIYLLIALKQLAFMTPCPMLLDMEEGRKFYFHKVYFAAVMNQKYEGGGFRFCPDASPSDGVLDVIVVEGLPKLKLLVCLPTAFFGKHTIFKGVHTFRCKRIKLHSTTPLSVHMDGEPNGLHRELSVIFEKKALKVLLPVV